MESVSANSTGSNAPAGNQSSAAATKAEHTPGPFGVDDRLLYRTAPQEWVGVGPLVGGDDDDANEVAAYAAFCDPDNAPLFAAAPDLLAACEAAVAAFDSGDMVSRPLAEHWADLRAARELAFAAIAKAVQS